MFNRALRFVYQLRKYSHITPFRQKAQLPSLTNRRKYYMVTMLNRIIHTKTPAYLSSSLRTIDDETRRTPRTNVQTPTFVIPVAKSTYILNSFRYLAIKEWTIIPSCLTSLNNISAYNSALLNHYTYKDTPSASTMRIWNFNLF